MRKLLVIGVALVLASALAGSAAAAGADIYAVGAGKTDVGTLHFSMSAHEGPNGDFGQVGVTELSGVSSVSYKVDLDCVAVNATFDTAHVSGIVKKVSPVPNFLSVDVGDRLNFLAEDNGEPSPPTPVDAFLRSPFGNFAACDILSLVFATPNVTQGNVNIKAADE
jgi:hypothetical protein